MVTNTKKPLHTEAFLLCSKHSVDFVDRDFVFHQPGFALTIT